MKLTWRDCIKIGVSIFALYLCINYWKNAAELITGVFSAAMPLLIGCIIAYLLNILMSFYEKRIFAKTKKRGLLKIKRPICMIGAFLTLIAIIVLVVSLVVPQLVSCVRLIFDELPDAINYVIKVADEWRFVPENIIDFLKGIDWNSRIGGIIEAFTSGMGNVMDVVVRTVSSVFSGIVTTLLSIIFAIYLLMSKDTLKSQADRLINHYLSTKIYIKIKYVFSVLNDCFHRYIVGQCTEAVILGLLCTLGMWILRLPYAPMIGALVAFTALIPVAGAYIGAGVGAFMILMVSPVKALIFLIFILVLQQLEGNLIYPKVVGSSIGLPAIWVLAAITIGGGLLGIFGMLLGVPVAAAIYRIIRDDINKDIPSDNLAIARAKQVNKQGSEE